MELVFGYAIPVLFIIGCALATAFAGVLQYRLTAQARPELRLAAAMLVVGFGALLSVALTTRDLDDSKATTGATYADFADGFASSRWFSLFLVAASFVEIVRGRIAAWRRPEADPAWPLLVTMLGYYLGTALIQAVASDHPEFAPRSLYVPIVLAAIWYQRPAAIETVVAAARLVILTLMLGSLAAIWLRPGFVIHRPEPGLIPGVDWRLFGLTPHANAIGPIALLGILIELHSPARWRVLRWAALASSAAVLVLAQSKTTWGMLPLMAVCVWLPLRLRQAASGSADPFRRAVLTLTGVIVVLVLLSAAAAAFDVAGYVEHRIDLVTLTGRTQIWEITLRAWRENMLFGYGAGIWGPERQREFNMFYVGHAHNQVVQTLGEAGLVGLALLLAYLGALLLAALRSFVATRGFVLMLLMLMLVRGITEAPMRSEGVLSWSTFVHALLLAMACHAVRQPRRGAVTETRAASAPRRVGSPGTEVALHGR